MTAPIAELIDRAKRETDYDRWQAAWLEIFKARGHTPIRDGEGRVDFFVTNPTGHNGPGCVTCGWTRCMHCCWVEQIPECQSRSVPAPGTAAA